MRNPFRFPAAAVLAALCVRPVIGDIVSMKDGSVVECEIVTQTVANGRQVLRVRLENGQTRDIPADRIAWVARAKPSWIVRKENREWYQKQLERKGDKLQKSWRENFNLGRDCRRRKYLEAEAEKHFRKAYELRRKELKDTIADHKKVALWLERSCGLFDLAMTEWQWVYARKLEEMKAKAEAKGKEPDDGDWYKMGRWAEQHSLYDEALTCYETSVRIEPRNRLAAKGIERIKNLRETLVNPKLYRTIKEPFGRAVAAFRGKQNGNGSFGADVSEAGVQGLRGMSGLCTLALLSAWRFDSVENPDARRQLPKETEKAIQFLLGAPVNTKKLRGPDLWGNIWTVHVMVEILKDRNLKQFHSQAKAKFQECLGALSQMQGPDGGWMYYNFARRTGASFTGGALLVALAEAKEEGIPVDEQLFSRAVKHLKSLKQSDGVFMYRTGVRQKVEGSQGRAGVCELALYKCGQGSKEAIRVAVDNFFKYHHILEAVKGKKGTHMGTGGTAPYYFLYGHMWIARAIKELDDAARDSYQAKLRDVFLPHQEGDGSFFDWPMTKKHKVYGSAMGALTLYHIGTINPRGRGRRR